MARDPRLNVLLLAGAAGFLLGLGSSALDASGGVRLRASDFADMRPLPTLQPIRALPRTMLVLAMEEARSELSAGRPWAAWTTLRPHVMGEDDVAAPAVLLAARAAAGWGGWDHVRTLLRGQSWLDREGGEGWFLLGRADEEANRWESAANAYRSYLASARGEARGMAHVRLGRVLVRSGEPAQAAAAFAAAVEDLPEIEDWLRALQAEALAASGDVRAANVPLAARPDGRSAAARVRRAEAAASAWVRAGRTAEATAFLAREARVLAGVGARGEAATLALRRARLLLDESQTAPAREALRGVAWEASAPTSTRLDAARLLGESGGLLGAADELARASAYEAAGRPGLAARSLRAALSAGAPDDVGARLRIAHLLFDARDHRPARAAFLHVAERLNDPEQKAEALVYAARAHWRAGEKGPALAELRQVVERHPGTPAAGSALFHLADGSTTLKAAIPLYRQAADVRASPDAREALVRLADRRLKAKDTAGAFAAWEEYVGRYPHGEETARIAYRAARLHDRAGRSARARKMYLATVQADPVSYEAVRAAQYARVDPLGPALGQPEPWVGLASDPVDARHALARLDRLEQAGLDDAWQAELDAGVRRLERRPVALLVLAEGLRDRRHALDGIRLGRRLLATRGGRWDERLLRVVFPFPFREVIEEEAERSDVDPMLFAALVRQESTFRPAVRSRVGATGLSQIMPTTGRWLAEGMKIGGYQDRLLTVPEVNARMGARYLGDLLRRYDGAEDLALAGYNAGPGRADKWRKTLGHGGDPDVFRDRIPFDETRHYVKIVLRNAAVYERLYGEGGSR